MPKTSGIVLLMTFRGRSSRLLWWLGHVGAVAAVAAADTAYDMTGTEAAAIISGGVFVLAVYLHCTLTATRLRDVGFSPWVFLITLLPLQPWLVGLFPLVAAWAVLLGTLWVCGIERPQPLWLTPPIRDGAWPPSMNAEYRVCERCHGTGGKWAMNLEQHLHSNVWVRCPGCGGSRWVVVRPAEALTPEQQAGIEKMLSTLDTPNTQRDPAAPTPDYYEAEQWAERQAEAAAPTGQVGSGSVVANVPNPNRKGRFPMSKVLALGGGVLAMAALGLAGFLFVQMNQTKASLDAALDDLRGARGEIETQTAANGALELSLGEARFNVAALTAARASLRSDNTRLLADKDDLGAANGRLQATLKGYRSQSATLKQDLADAVQRAEEQLWDNQDLRVQYQDLQTLAGTVDTLDGRASDLRGVIADLEERRKPLILTRSNAPKTGFRCTGSMEPTITCLDEAVWLEDFRPEDVAVGAVISYDPDCNEAEANGTGTSHRVMDIKVRNGVYQYWPKGDANDEPDGCWVPHTNVTGYIIKLHRDAAPENAWSRDWVNGAKAAQADAERVYLDLIERFCGHRNPARCTVPRGDYPTVATAYNEYLKAHQQWKCALRSATAPPGRFYPCELAAIIPTLPF